MTQEVELKEDRSSNDKRIFVIDIENISQIEAEEHIKSLIKKYKLTY